MILSGLARIKAQDMVSNGYFSHYSPTHGSLFDMMKADQAASPGNSGFLGRGFCV